MAKKRECSNCKKLSREIEALRKEVRALRDELRRGHRQAAPFSREQAKDNPKKPGRKKGNETFIHRKPPPEKKTETMNVPLDHCPHCCGPLTEK